MHRATILLSVGVFGLMGCQSFTGFSTNPPNASTAPAGNSQPNFLSSMAPGAIDGSGPGQSVELPKQKKLEACLAAAKLMESSGKVGEAIGYYEQIRQLDSRRNLFCSRHLAVLYDRNGDFDKALDEYNKLLQANPKDADTYNDLGYGYYCRGKFEVAEKNLRKAVELDPKNKRAWSNLGMTLAQLSRYEESVTAFEKAVNRPQALCNIAFIQAAQGKWVEARDSYAQALRLEPGLQKARVALQRMEEGPRRNKDRDRQEAKRRARELELEQPRQFDPALAGALPFGAPVGSAAGDAGMVVIGNDETPMRLPTLGEGLLPTIDPASASSSAAAVQLPPANLPPIPSTRDLP